MRGVLRSEKKHQFVARAADVSGADGQDGVAWLCRMQEEFNSRLHGAEVVNVLVARLANGVGERFASDAGNRGFACGINVRKHENIRLVEGTAEVVPEMFCARVAVRLEQRQDAIELAATCGIQRGANFRGV